MLKIRQPSKDDGFTVIEVLVAFTLLAIVTLGTVPLFVSGLRASLVSKLDTGAKNLAQERIEQMRNLPFHVDVNSSSVPTSCYSASNTNPITGGAVNCDYRDLLDTYYRSKTVATSTATSGWVPSTSTVRTTDEPPTGAFYRFAINPVSRFSNRYSQFVATQFLDVNRVPLDPASTYNSQVSGADFPPSRLVGVTVVTKWTAGAISKKYVAFTQIAEGRLASSQVITQARAASLLINTDLDSTRQLNIGGGISDSNGALSTGSSASTSLQSLFADIVPGSQITGKTLSASAPPDSTSGSLDLATSQSLLDGTNEIVYVSGGNTSNGNVSIVNEQPVVATSTAQATGQVRRLNTIGIPLFGMTNLPDASLPFLDTTSDTSGHPRIVRMNECCGTGGISGISGSTYLLSTAGSGHSSEAGTKANTQTIDIMPTTFSPVASNGLRQGVVRVTLTSASLVCTTNGTTASATASFSATVAYLKFNATTNTNTYVTATVTSGSASPLTTLLPSTIQISTAPNGTASAALSLIPLSTYINSWSSLSTASTTTTTPPTNVTSNLNGIVSVSTQPTRTGDSASAIGLKFGVLSCVAEDDR
jgi:Tfp pilus assembly protein PilV